MIYLLIALVALYALERYLGTRDSLDLLEAERRKAREERRDLMETHAAERATLLDRIQRPEVVPPAAMPDDPPERTTVYYGDDEDLKSELKRLDAEPEWFREAVE